MYNTSAPLCTEFHRWVIGCEKVNRSCGWRTLLEFKIFCTRPFNSGHVDEGIEEKGGDVHLRNHPEHLSAGGRILTKVHFMNEVLILNI